MHLFDESREIGSLGETELDAFFARWYEIEEPEFVEDLAGVDRYFRHKFRRISVQYKTDFEAGSTGNVFVETVSKDEPFQPGWAYKGKADWLVYWVPLRSQVYVMSMNRLRQQLGPWMANHKTRAARNGTWTSYGVCVPLRKFEEHRTQQMKLEPSEALVALFREDKERRGNGNGRNLD